MRPYKRFDMIVRIEMYLTSWLNRYQRIVIFDLDFKMKVLIHALNMSGITSQ